MDDITRALIGLEPDQSRALRLLRPKATSDEEHSESEFYYPDELVFNENMEENVKT